MENVAQFRTFPLAFYEFKNKTRCPGKPSLYAFVRGSIVYCKKNSPMLSNLHGFCILSWHAVDPGAGCLSMAGRIRSRFGVFTSPASMDMQEEIHDVNPPFGV